MRTRLPGGVAGESGRPLPYADCRASLENDLRSDLDLASAGGAVRARDSRGGKAEGAWSSKGIPWLRELRMVEEIEEFKAQL